MIRRSLSAVVLLVGSLAAQTVDPDVSYVQFTDAYVHGLALGDVDADGRPDLVVGSSLADGVRRLTVHVHRGERPAYRSEPERELRLVRDVVAYAVADVDAAPGDEIVLFSPTRAVSVRWNADQPEPQYAALARIELLWQPPAPGYAISWQAGVADLDRDGLDDLLIPERDGYRVLVQRRDPEIRFVESRLRTPPQPVSVEERSQLRFRDRSDDLRGSLDLGDARQRGILLQVDDRVAAPQVGDWNADGRDDVVALIGRRLAVWQQTDAGTFPAAPTLVHDLPERGIPLFDPSFDVQLVDLEGDGRAEVVVVSGRTEGDTVQSVVELFRQGDDGALFEAAADRLLLQGFTNAPAFDDVDGDGVGDLAIGSLRTDVIDTLTAGRSGTVDAQLNLFVGRPATDGGRFRRPVALVHRLSMPGSALGSTGRLLARFLRDVDGDGTRDLFLRVDGETLAVLPVTANGRRLTVGAPAWQLRTATDAPLEVVPHAASLSLVVVEPGQVVHVEFR